VGLSTAAFAPNVTYVSFFHDLSASASITSDSVYMANVSAVDDQPFQFLRLPWKFPYFGENIETFWVSPNGGFFKQAAGNYPYCQSNVNFYTDECNLNTAFYGLLAGFYTDLNPVLFNGSSITYTTFNASLQVLFSQVPFYGPYTPTPAPVTDADKTSTFGVELFRSGQVNLHFYNLYMDGVSVNDVPYFLTGMRQFADTSGVVYTSQQVEAAGIWSTSVLGVYPATIASVQSNLTFTSCPLSTAWTLSPSSINVFGETTVNVSFHPLSASCFVNSTQSDFISFAVCIRSADSDYYEGGFNQDGYFDASDVSADCPTIVDKCVYTAAAGAPVSTSTLATDVYVHCAVTPEDILSSLGLSALNSSATGTAALLQVAWKHAGVDSFASIPVPPVPVTFYNSSHAPIDGNCSVNVDTTASVLSTEDAACALFDGNTTSFDMDCPADSTDGIYDYLACSGTCLPFDMDYNRDCCEVYEEMDCSGLCNGRSYFQTSSTFSNLSYCCSNVDFCGVCGGNDFNGSTCLQGLLVETEFSDNNIYSYYDIAPFTTTTSAADDHSDFGVLNITNINANFSLWVSIGLERMAGSDPFVEVTESSGAQLSLVTTSESSQQSTPMEIAPGVTVSLLVKSNISNLIQEIIAESTGVESAPSWTVKKIKIISEVFNAVDFTASLVEVEVSLFPASYNCSASPPGKTTESNMCSKLPGCIFCRNFNHMRILKEADEGTVAEADWVVNSQMNFAIWQEIRANSRAKDRANGVLLLRGAAVDTEAEAEAEAANARRQLYIPIMPPENQYTDWEKGVCNDGWLTRECDYSAFVSSAAPRRYFSVRIGLPCTAFVLFIYLFI